MTASTDFQAILSKLSGSSWAASKETVSGPLVRSSRGALNAVLRAPQMTTPRTETALFVTTFPRRLSFLPLKKPHLPSKTTSGHIVLWERKHGRAGWPRTC